MKIIKTKEVQDKFRIVVDEAFDQEFINKLSKLIQKTYTGRE